MSSNPTLRTILIITLFALVTIWLFSEPPAKKENYDNTVTEHNVEPTDHLKSYGVRFMPHVTEKDETVTDSDYSTFRVYDHTDLQRKGNNFVYDAKQPECVVYKDRGQDIRDVAPDTSLQRACKQGNRVIDSNDINGVCSNDTLLENDSYAYSNKIHEHLDMDMTKEEHHSLYVMRPHMKTFIEVDQNAGKFDCSNAEYEKAREGQTLEFEDIQKTIKRYRDDTLRSIRNGNEHNASVRNSCDFYDSVH